MRGEMNFEVSMDPYNLRAILVTGYLYATSEEVKRQLHSFEWLVGDVAHKAMTGWMKVTPWREHQPNELVLTTSLPGDGFASACCLSLVQNEQGYDNTAAPGYLFGTFRIVGMGRVASSVGLVLLSREKVEIRII